MRQNPWLKARKARTRHAVLPPGVRRVCALHAIIGRRCYAGSARCVAGLPGHPASSLLKNLAPGTSIPGLTRLQMHRRERRL